MSGSLEIFQPLVGKWFLERVGEPTPVQVAAWPRIASGEHLLVMAPTGSGKTLTAFLWALHQLITGQWPCGGLRVLYVSPLRALNNDIQRNLLTPLQELRQRFEEANAPFPDIQVLTRSGDTEQRERQRMLRRPPEILITTPESLNLILSSRNAQGMLTTVETVILDEVHAVADSKRGAHLITAVDRLARLSGEFQRLALSATVRPVERIAEFVGGYRLETRDGRPCYLPRPVGVIAGEQTKQYEIQVRFPADGFEEQGGPVPFLERIAEECKQIIQKNRSTLLFTNSRRLCERLALLINRDEEVPVAYSHHGSLAREMRMVVEERLKRGELKAIVATSSLELGIDIGALDEVALVQTPVSVSSAVQRVGRAGHQVGTASRATLFATHGRDLLDAAVLAPLLVEHDIEPIEPVSNPLDVLAQIIVSMAGVEPWDVDALYAHLRTSWPYRDLPRRPFDLVLEMLAGRYQDSRVRALQPLVSLDRIDHTVVGRDASLRLVHSSGGAIPDRGYFAVRRADTRGKIGELDEEFVWERSVGDTFTMGLQSWRIREITHSDVLVEPAGQTAGLAPFWRAEERHRSFPLSERIGLFLESANGRLDDPSFVETLRTDHFLEESAAGALVRFLKRQRAATDAALPHRHHLLIEYVVNDGLGDEGTRVVLHTLWGGRLNRPFATALAHAWRQRHHRHLDVFTNNDCVVLTLPAGFNRLDPFSLVPVGAAEGLLRDALEQTGFFGARFRENAARALLLPRRGFRRRMPLWLNRQRSKKLLEAVLPYEDFPILLETWRTCLRDEFELETLDRLLDEVRSGAIRCTEVTTRSPSPFASEAIWRQTNAFIYADDTPVSGSPSRLRTDVLQEAVFDAALRPRLARELVELFRQKAQRVFEGYAPRTSEELLDWVKERLLIPEGEWTQLLNAVERDHRVQRDDLLAPIAAKLAEVRPPGSDSIGVAAVEWLPRLLAALDPEGAGIECRSLDGKAVRVSSVRDSEAKPEDESGDPLAGWLGEWLRFYGPVEKEFLRCVFPVEESRFDRALETLVETEALVVDQLIATDKAEPSLEVCDSENLEVLLRLGRAQARPSLKPLPVGQLQLFLALHQGLVAGGKHAGQADLHRRLEQLFGYPFPPQLLETEFLPARLRPYALAMLDEAMNESDLIWFGCGDRRIVLSFLHNRDLFVCSEGNSEDDDLESLSGLFPDRRGRYTFESLIEASQVSVGELTELLWRAVWEGQIANDSFGALRKGLEAGFKPFDAGRRGQVSRRRRFHAWKSSRAYPGNWYRLPRPDPPGDAVDQEEQNRDRVRVLLDRYGILFRELLTRELPIMSWSAVFGALRRMELAGEVYAGCFFEGIPGLQFISPSCLPVLQGPLSEDGIFWLNAADPASLCGVELEGVKGDLPNRVSSTHLTYHGSRLVVVSRRNGGELNIRVQPDHPHLHEYFGFMKNLLTRQLQPLGSISIRTINGKPAGESPYVPCLADLFDVSIDAKAVTVWKKTWELKEDQGALRQEM